MDTLLIGLLLGVSSSLVVAWLAGRKKHPSHPEQGVQAYIAIEGIRAVGELVVLKVFTQQIITKTNHLFGDWGERWLAWLVSSKKTAMIFEFVVDFRYDLKSPKFTTTVVGNSGIHFVLPPCFYEIQLKDISIYDEKASALAPILLPEWLGQVFGGKFTEKEKNRLIRAARDKAEEMACQLSGRMMGEVRKCAESALRSISKGMGFTEVSFDFQDEGQVHGTVNLMKFEESVRNAIGSE
ncbi:MAG: DUF4230 domain-containing protein [Candidatus Omnitrophica bacterium]|nr:MAG: hypothetical protein UZ16_OP3001003539 [Candidatus Hinthialibacteria bacterium OLB16]MBV6482839.1 hypothetical protein [bacterium]MCC6731926.1 DUF4230 domain-containing protein [Candidatus Omnitrophota bacterium]MCE7909053.1 DUF4230 domain-containing protein [Candidatus Omnitrophica bacterium COP1]MCK6495498.1 DUF4230 domain-containing protein [bacterium]